MPYLANIVSKIDELILSSSLTDQRFQNKFFAGLVQQLPVTNSDGTKVIFVPAIPHGLTDATQVVPDDNYNLITYHRIIGNAYSFERIDRQFGDGLDVQKSVSDVIMVVIGFNNKLLITQEQLEALFIGGFPDVFEKAFVQDLKFNSISIQPVSSNLDSVAVFNQEYRGDKYYIRQEMSLFQIRYSITATYKKGCFTICEDC